MTKQGCEVWLLNDTEEPLDVSHGELFGFNVGTFTDRAVGRAQVVQASRLKIASRFQSLNIHI